MCDACMQPYPEPLLPCFCSWCQVETIPMSSEVDNNDDTVQYDEQ